MQPTAPLLKSLRRLALSTKQASKLYYKGTRTGAMGRHTKHGRYIVDYMKVRTYVVPLDINDSNLTPFVATRVEPERGFFSGTKGPMDGETYLEKWKMENGQD